MKILHTADLHLGARLDTRDREAEQRKILNEITAVANGVNADIVIVAGDVYHNSTPSAQAEDMFFDFVDKISDGGNRLVFVLSGNHDDPERLGACNPLAIKRNIVVASSLDIDFKNTPREARARILDAGRGYVRVKVGEEECVLAFLPFFGEQKCKELAGGGDLTYNEAIMELARVGASHFSPLSVNIFVSHLFVAGAKLADNGEVKVGDVMAITPDVFPKNAHIVALGHLHRAQKIGSNVYYPGSTIELRFNDHRPSVNVIDVTKGGVASVKQVPLASACELRQIRVKNMAYAIKELSLAGANELIELTFVQNEPLKATEIKELKRSFPNLCGVRLELISAETESEERKVSRRQLSDQDLFIQFYKQKTGAEPSPRLVEMFLEIRRGTDDAD